MYIYAKIDLVFTSTVPVTSQRSFWLWAKPMRDTVTMYRRLSLDEPIPRMILVIIVYHYWCIRPADFSAFLISFSQTRAMAYNGGFFATDLPKRCLYMPGRQCLHAHGMLVIVWRIWYSRDHIWPRAMNNCYKLTKIHPCVYIVWLRFTKAFSSLGTFRKFSEITPHCFI